MGQERIQFKTYLPNLICPPKDSVLVMWAGRSPSGIWKGRNLFTEETISFFAEMSCICADLLFYFLITIKNIII